MIELPVRRLREDAVLPERAYAGDAGLDLAACEQHELGPGERAVVGTGLAVAIPAGYAGFVQPRSGLAARHGLSVVNAPGLIDSGYRGEIRVVLLNTDRREPFLVEAGMRMSDLASTLAACEFAGASGQQLLTALATAYEVQAVFSEHAPLQEKGFDHVTHLAFSIPAGLTNALGLERRVGANAMAMCGCAINTLWVIRTGRLSSWKGFASAEAAKACMHMTLLATRGLSGPLNLMEGPQGWEEVVGERIEVDWPKQP